MNKTLALATALVLLVLVPAATARAPQHSTSVVDRGSSHVSGFLYVITYVTVTPHRPLGQSFEFTSDYGGALPKCIGGGVAESTEDGINYGVDQLTTVDPEHVPGQLRGWWREPGTGCTADPVILDDGPAEITMSVP